MYVVKLIKRFIWHHLKDHRLSGIFIQKVVNPFHDGFDTKIFSLIHTINTIVNNLKIPVGKPIIIMSQPQVKIPNAAVQLIHDAQLLALCHSIVF